MSRTPKRSTLSNELIARYPMTLTAADLLASSCRAKGHKVEEVEDPPN